MGRNAVAGTGMASVAHQIAIQSPTAAARQACGSMKLCHCSVANMTAKTAGPRIRPMT